MTQKAVTAALAIGDGVALWLLRPDVSGLVDVLATPHRAVARAGADAALVPIVGALVWLAAAWLGGGLLIAAAARLPGRLGRAALRGSRLLLPAVLRRLLVGGAGVGIALAPGAAAVAAPATSPATTAPAAVRAPIVLSAPALVAIAAPAWPSGSPPPSRPAHHAAHTAGAAPVTGGRAPVLVRPGDSLWSVASRSLGAAATPRRVAREWPRWFTANRREIGPDPRRLRPGERLNPPP